MTSSWTLRALFVAVVSVVSTTASSASQGPGVAMGTASPMLQEMMSVILFGFFAGLVVIAGIRALGRIR